MAAENLWTTDPRDALRAGPDFDLAAFDRNGHPGWDGSTAKMTQCPSKTDECTT